MSSKWPLNISVLTIGSHFLLTLRVQDRASGDFGQCDLSGTQTDGTFSSTHVSMVILVVERGVTHYTLTLEDSSQPRDSNHISKDLKIQSPNIPSYVWISEHMTEMVGFEGGTLS